jgi:hypothetical protein
MTKRKSKSARLLVRKHGIVQIPWPPQSPHSHTNTVARSRRHTVLLLLLLLQVSAQQLGRQGHARGDTPQDPARVHRDRAEEEPASPAKREREGELQFESRNQASRRLGDPSPALDFGYLASSRGLRSASALLPVCGLRRAGARDGRFIESHRIYRCDTHGNRMAGQKTVAFPRRLRRQEVPGRPGVRGSR